MRLLAFLRKKCPEAPSVKALKRAIDSKGCRVNRRIEIFASHPLRTGDVVSLDPAFFHKEAVARANVLYEDEDLLVLDKPPGMVCDLPSLSRHCKGIELVHRLDKETSGALLVAKHRKMKDELIALFKKRAIHKVYLAIVDGLLAKDEGTVEDFLGKVGSYHGQTLYGPVSQSRGDRAVTHWKCLKRGKEASLVQCEPVTGRTHQLRVHLSGLGHPILGDGQYGKAFRSSLRPRRHLLHAYALRLTHPRSQEELEVIAPVPADFSDILKLL